MQARSAAAAFEQAFATTVPPPLVAANRAQLMLLIATNLLGQNIAAIAATEAEYAEMWAKDAVAMNGYATASAAASMLTPFVSPEENTDPAGLAASSGMTTLPGTEGAEAGMPGVPGAPIAAPGRAGIAIPRYGVKLTVMPRAPAAG